VDQKNERWYGLLVRTRFEQVVASNLGMKGFEGYLPTYPIMRRWSDREKQLDVPLFPGSVFCKFDINERLRLLLIPGVMSVVKFGGLPLPIPESRFRLCETL
jgi:transcription antitermination factor NusG